MQKYCDFDCNIFEVIANAGEGNKFEHSGYAIVA